jgi:hypothetical protein
MTKLAARRFQAPEEGLLASLLLAFLAASGLFYVNIMPALVDGLISGLGYTSKQAGIVASFNVYGAAAGAFAAVFLVRRFHWKRVVATALGLLIALDLTSILITDFQILTGVRFLHGLTGGTVMGMVFGVIARTRTPDRTFGMLLLVQYGIGGLGLLFLPRLVPVFGSGVLFVSLAAFSALAMSTMLVLADYPLAERKAKAAGAGRVRWGPLVLAFAAIFLFQAANMGVSAYVIGLGREAGLGTGYISGALGIANWIGVVGAVLVIVMGLKFGRLWPFLIGMAVTLAGIWAFHLSDRAGLYFVANAVTSVTWSFVIPYLLGMAAAFDETGEMGALGGFFSKIGLASGPLAGAFILGEGGYAGLVNAGLAGLVLCILAGLAPALMLDRSRPATLATPGPAPGTV